MHAARRMLPRRCVRRVATVTFRVHGVRGGEAQYARQRYTRRGRRGEPAPDASLEAAAAVLSPRMLHATVQL